MSGGDFLSRSEAAICGRRRIDDRIQVLRDLDRVVARHGAIGAADQLDLRDGDIERLKARKMAIGPALLVSLYGAGGNTLVKGLAAPAGDDAAMARLLAAVAAKPVAAKPVDPAPDDARLRVIMREAETLLGGKGVAARAVGISVSQWGFLKQGARPFSQVTRDLLLDWHRSARAGLMATPATEDAPATLPTVPPVTGRVAREAGLAENFQRLPVADDAVIAEIEGCDFVAEADAGAVAVALDVVPVEQPSPDTAAVADDLPPPGSKEMPSAVGQVVAAPETPALPPPHGLDPIAAALATLRSGIDDAMARKDSFDWPLAELAGQIAALEEQRAAMLAEQEIARREAGRLIAAKQALLDVVRP